MPLLLLGLPLFVVCFFGWVVSEGNCVPRLRVAFALGGFFFAALAGVFVGGFSESFNYNVYFGSATLELTETILEQLQQGNTEGVVVALRGLKAEYRPTYEHKAGYLELARKSAAYMRGELPRETYRLPEFDRDVWDGVWEAEDALFLKIEVSALSIEVRQLLVPMSENEATSLPPGNRTLEFALSDNRTCTLQLRDNFVADYTITDPNENNATHSGVIVKLIPATQTARDSIESTTANAVPAG
ncbi:MAG: hypothetical protein AMXMBFR84_24050 [Candidatus Hydrogenedentota bacterium]